MKRTAWPLSLVMILSLMLGACGPTPAPAATTAPAEEGVVAPTTAPAEEDKTWVILAEEIPPCLDWDGFCGPSFSAQTAWNNVYLTLVDYKFPSQNDEGVWIPDFGSFEGVLAESWEVTEDGMTWTFHLRKGVISAAGNEMTADDVLWTFARAKSVSGTSPIGWFLGNVASILPLDPMLPDATAADKELKGEVVKIDDYTVQINLFETNPIFLNVLAIFALAIPDSKECLKHATEADPWAHEWMGSEGACGFAPYHLVKWEKDKEFVVEANPNWYDPPPVNRIIYRKVPESTNRFAAILTGDADIVEHLTPKEFNLLEGKPGVKVQGHLGNQNTFLILNWNTPPWDDVKMRKAIAYAIPYDEIIETVYFGDATRWHSLIPPGYFGYAAFEMYDFDLEKAKELLAEAGYPDGQGLDQYRENLQISYPIEKGSALEPIALLMRTRLAEIGVPIELNPIPMTQFVDRSFVKKDMPMALDDWETPIAPDTNYGLLLFYVSTEAGGLNNITNYSNPRVDELFLLARPELDEAKRNEYLREAQEILMDELARVPIVIRKTQRAMAENVTDYHWYQDDFLRWWRFGAK